ncbi:MAG: PHP domain-containing protein [Pseudomonadota bacterium]
MSSDLIDLHIHTSVSDGTYSPTEIVHLAQTQGLKAISITDHDTIKGNEEAIKVGMERGLEVIPGVEISVEWNKCPIHIIGYFVNWQSQSLAVELQNLVEYREERNCKIISKLHSLGLDISYDEVKMIAGDGTIGRPHFAQVLIKKAYAKNEDEAFKKYLQRGAPAHVDKKRLNPQEGIHLIKNAGGIAILAHPFTTEEIKDNEMEQFILHFKRLGIEGVEVFYPIHTPQQTFTLRAITEKYGLLMTGGSDFHGEQKPTMFLGRGFGNMYVHYELIENMKKKLRTGKELD